MPHRPCAAATQAIDPPRPMPAGSADSAGLMARPPEMGAPPLWVAYVGVPDLRATLARAVELGGTVHVEPMAVREIGELAVIGDPQGAPLGLLGPEG